MVDLLSRTKVYCSNCKLYSVNPHIHCVQLYNIKTINKYNNIIQYTNVETQYLKKIKC